MKSITTQYLTLLIISLFAVASCTTVELPKAYPSVVVKPKPRPVVVAAPKPKPKPNRSVPEINQPVVKAVIKPKPRQVIVRAYKPEQGDNPYDSVPTTRASSAVGANPAVRATTTVKKETPTSPAVKSLLIQAKAAMLVNRNAAAIEKLERALRIESNNPLIWHQLAKAHYNRKDDVAAISMAKKSNRYVDEGSPLEKQNWQVIMAASKRSENIKSLKAAILYERAHP